MLKSKLAIGVMFVLVFLLPACASAPTPTVIPVAIPTLTPIPPPIPTATPEAPPATPTPNFNDANPEQAGQAYRALMLKYPNLQKDPQLRIEFVGKTGNILFVGKALFIHTQRGEIISAREFDKIKPDGTLYIDPATQSIVNAIRDGSVYSEPVNDKVYIVQYVAGKKMPETIRKVLAIIDPKTAQRVSIKDLSPGRLVASLSTDTGISEVKTELIKIGDDFYLAPTDDLDKIAKQTYSAGVKAGMFMEGNGVDLKLQYFIDLNGNIKAMLIEPAENRSNNQPLVVYTNENDAVVKVEVPKDAKDIGWDSKTSQMTCVLKYGTQMWWDDGSQLWLRGPGHLETYKTGEEEKAVVQWLDRLQVVNDSSTKEFARMASFTNIDTNNPRPMKFTGGERILLTKLIKESLAKYAPFYTQRFSLSSDFSKTLFPIPVGFNGIDAIQQISRIIVTDAYSETKTKRFDNDIDSTRVNARYDPTNRTLYTRLLQHFTK